MNYSELHETVRLASSLGMELEIELDMALTLKLMNVIDAAREIPQVPDGISYPALAAALGALDES